MAFWHIFGRTAVSDEGETIRRVSESTSVSSDGTIYNHSGSTTFGSDGSMFTQCGSSSSDGSFRTGSSADGLGAVFNRVGDGEKRRWGDDW